MELVVVPKIPEYDKRINLGDISHGSFRQQTYLGSCVSLIMHTKGYGALSHITESEIGEFNTIEKVLEEFENIKNEQKLNPEYYLIGGFDAPFKINNPLLVYNKIVEHLKSKKIKFKSLDKPCGSARFIVYDPIEEKIWVQYLRVHFS